MKIKNGDKITLDEYIEESLYNKKFGYYVKKVPFGKSGDFITAPNISVLFSEMLAIWVISFWENLGCPKKFNLIELGAGNGEMMRVLNKTFSTKEFNNRIVGGYDFEWIITEMEYRDFDFYLYGKTLPVGTVTLMDGRHLSLNEAIKDEDLGWEIKRTANLFILI